MVGTLVRIGVTFSSFVVGCHSVAEPLQEHRTAANTPIEITLREEKPHPDPFYEVTLDVLFKDPVLLASLEDGLLDIALDPEAHQTKGIFFHYQQNPAQSHSSRGRVDKGFQPTADREWLIRAWVGPAPAE